MKQQHLIAVDWGTSHLRAYLCSYTDSASSVNAQALTLQASKTGAGVLKVTRDFETELFAVLQPWLDEHGTLPIIMMGQIGSNIGWQETPYLACPVTPSDVAAHCVHFDSRSHQIAIVPGVSCTHNNGMRDVMRGEEIQVLGWLQHSPAHQVGEHIVCLPGTHTKWVRVTNGQIQVFKTALTGELFDLLSHGSVLIQQHSDEFDFATFEQGVRFTLESGSGSFSHGLFSVRSKQLFGELAPHNSQAYLSGILIGSDVRAALNATEWSLAKGAHVSVIGSKQVSNCFAKALQLAGMSTTLYSEKQTSLNGIAVVNQIAKRIAA